MYIYIYIIKFTQAAKEIAGRTVYKYRAPSRDFLRRSLPAFVTRHSRDLEMRGLMNWPSPPKQKICSQSDRPRDSRQ